MRISIIIPIKDETYIQALVNRIHRQLSKISHEIIVVDKGRHVKKINNVKHMRNLRTSVRSQKLRKGSIIKKRETPVL